LKLKEAFKEYEQYMIVEKGYSRLTIESYKKDIQFFLTYLHDKKEINQIEEIQKDHIYAYLKEIDQELEKSSIRRKITALKRFFLFLTRENMLENNVMSSFENVKIKQHLPTVLSVDEMLQLLNSISLDTPESYRNRCMVELLYATGLRVSEMCQLKLEDLNLKNQTLKCLGKGQKERIVPLYEQCCLLLKEYIEVIRPEFCKNISTPYVFLNKKGSVIKRDHFYHILQKIIQNSGLKKHVTPHTLRHTFATHLLDNDADIRSIQELLGHSNISTTTIYTHVSQKKLIDEYEKLHPRIQKGKKI